MKSQITLFLFIGFTLSATLAAGDKVSAQSGYNAEIVKTRIVPFRTAQGSNEQMLLVDWKNTGTLPIGQVKATMTFFNENGQQINQVKDYNIFVTYSQDKTIKPDKIYAEPDGDGFVIIATPPLYQKSARASAVLTKVAGIPSI